MGDGVDVMNARSKGLRGLIMTPKDRAIISEHQLQVAVSQYLDRALPLDAWWTSIDSAGRGAIAGAKMKRRGVKRGVPDILVIWRTRTLWIELKSLKGRPSSAQLGFSIAANNAGHWYRLCRSLEQVAYVMADAGIPLRARIGA
jgi:hypothetical protein